MWKVCIKAFWYTNNIIMNLTSSTSHKKTPSNLTSIRVFSFTLCSTFLFKLISIKINMNANNMKTKLFRFMKFDLRDHWRSHKAIFLSKSKIHLVLGYIFYLKYNVIKTLYECKHYENANFLWKKIGPRRSLKVT